ncbi:hypothetical protein T492DRAFT_941147 [Pavlovales sp. CCMP2436]|nr:hypothetical protein T492DRAFT_941147 [Pavlovales sp. CCMP2436]
MDEAIAQAEREAAMASVKAGAAMAKLVEWTDGERAVIKSLKRMSVVIEGADFQQVTNGFVEQHRHVFEFTDENKFEYSTLHEQYVELMEATLVEMAKDINMDALITNLPEFIQGRNHESDPEGTASTIDFLVSLTDFETFKNLMLAANMSDSGGPVLAFAADVDMPLKSLDDTLMPKIVVETARKLLSLAGPEAANQWKTSVAKNDMLMETAVLNGERYARLTTIIDLPVTESIEMMLDMAAPGREKWNQMAEKVEVHRSERTGKLLDQTVTVYFKLPGVARLIKSIKNHMTLRIAIQEDLPQDTMRYKKVKGMA